MNSDVDLKRQDLTDQDMEIVVKEGIINKKCKCLNLEWNNITSAGASILAHALTNNNTLEQLWLYNNHVGDDGVASFVKILSLNNNILKKLGLRNN
jgi:Ran GTPase-activating protein (RanGAP) involved in mRNA processing and transport